MRKLKKSNTDRFLFGVCGGLGEYFQVNPTIFRVIFVILALTGSAGIWIYLLLALAM